ncbi:zinc finger and BTB domain-containing protein 7B isoform 1-T3 [Synchiropus picturatus]
MSPGEDGLIGIPFPEHSNELLSHLNDQRRTGLLCDLTLTSRGARYPTHRSVMAAVSLYFRRLFGAEEAGGEGGGGFSVCQLDCVAPDALDALLEFAYTATLTIPSSGMRDVLKGAQLLGIQCVADACSDILGETAEAEIETAEQQINQHATPDWKVRENGGVKDSRRKTGRRKMRKVASHLINSSALNLSSASPFSYPSPSSDSVRSLTSTQPPSPDQEDLCPKPRQNGDPPLVREPGRGAAMNGGMLHWLNEPPRIAQPPPASMSHGKLSEDEMEGFGADEIILENTPVSTAVSEREEATPAVGRKRKSQTPQQCPVCQKIIHGAGKLPRHMRTHTGEKPFQCTACGVRFTRNDKLKIHMRKHTGERPYPCPHCSARFLHSYDLKNHLSLHSGARPFECLLCHKAFAREDHLQRHRKGHSCLEIRTRRPKHDTESGDEGGVDGAIQQSNPLESPSIQGRSSLFLPQAVLDGASGSDAVHSMIFQADTERERALSLHALAQLGAHRLANYPELFMRGLDLRGGRERDDRGALHLPQTPHNRWAEESLEETGAKKAQEEE